MEAQEPVDFAVSIEQVVRDYALRPDVAVPDKVLTTEAVEAFEADRGTVVVNCEPFDPNASVDPDDCDETFSPENDEI